jgi:hypothetical protein
MRSRQVGSTLALFASASAFAQAAPALELRPPVTAMEEFTRVVSVRELADGRLLVSDRRDNRVAVLSFDGAPASPLGRTGAGPGEYRAAGALIAMPGDSTALADANNGRYLLFGGPTIGGTIAMNGGAAKLPAIPVGISATHVYGYSYPEAGMGATAADTLALVRISRRNGATDTLARLAAQTVSRSAPKTDPDKVTVVHISISTWSAGDQALLFDDGWIAIARVAPYTVDWLSPDGQLHRGKPIRATNPPFDETEKRFFAERQAKETGRPPLPISSRSDWPEVVTPFTSASPLLGAPAPALFAGKGGRLIVRRQLSATDPQQRYDVVDRSGALVAQFVLGRREALIGAGKSHVYTVATDDDGIQRIRRYAWP